MQTMLEMDIVMMQIIIKTVNMMMGIAVEMMFLLIIALSVFVMMKVVLVVVGQLKLLYIHQNLE